MSNNDVNLNSFYSGNGEKRTYKKRKKRSRFIKWWNSLTKGKRIFLGVTSSILALLIVLGSVGLIWVNVILGKIGSDNDFPTDNGDLGFENVINENVFNIALFGVDSRKKGDFTGLSDSIMILSVNKSENTVKIVSIMRDSLVPVEHKGKVSYSKINSAYNRGGPTLAVKALNTVFGLDISAYATVNFYGMADIIEAIGGIEVEITQQEIDDTVYGLNALIKEHYVNIGKDPTPYYIYTPGVHKVNGMQAVAYARIRKAVNAYGSTDDFGRTERQRIVMKKIMEKALAMDVTTYPSLVNKLTPYVRTSLTNKQMLSLAAQLAKKPTLIQTRVPHDDYIINADYRGTGASAVYYNYKYAGKVIRAFLYDNIIPEDYFAANGVDLTGWHNSGTQGGSGGTTTSSPSGSSEPDDTDTSSSTSSADDPSEPEEPSEPSEPSEPENPDNPPTEEEPENSSGDN
ncbi:MAG: LytR family transcriptional regulator [Ruminococcaceae bacterium]|nr:LytR family transcriptional regulator [Oscillospiraceae bacterium]